MRITLRRCVGECRRLHVWPEDAQRSWELHDTDIGCARTLPHPGYLIAALAERLVPGFAAMITPGTVLPVLAGETTPCQWLPIKSVDRARWDARSFLQRGSVLERLPEPCESSSPPHGARLGDRM
ncbi:hypothetical protein ACDI35_17960 [Xanthomonas axonopodis pv. cajani]|uniref:hypothetical protein n=1 Tax=Xanthomonas axonopodis TaxID=53413 RepID=UPI00355629F9